ncbi:Uncharacterised protein [Mycobacteroides abscessus subsp. abscessus]|nr:Uncharacterised protein [Mycobacteroides abscessus subsp. abscessus]BBZ84129.1 hypothetical protein MABM_40450 [Mycobacteroides abscessus]SIK79810.1 Uncharacterised protein [Mycobacteroides abscessus subsp. abscessus]SIL22889.1 Uncharacterised protein [Mycobacteroides abscessus subsp. abscessus]SIL90413.1 Uncharacterised protein [Mycobacteroides abscessus subsp. abscessus]
MAERSVLIDVQPLTVAQGGAVGEALVAIIDGVPDALYGVKNQDGAPGAVLYTFVWVRGGVFGVLEVMRPAETDAQPPETKGWIRPLSSISKIEVAVKVVPVQPLSFDAQVLLGIKVLWPDGESIVLDGTAPLIGANEAATALDEVVRRVLRSVGAEVSEDDSSVDRR